MFQFSQTTVGENLKSGRRLTTLDAALPLSFGKCIIYTVDSFLIDRLVGELRGNYALPLCLPLKPITFSSPSTPQRQGPFCPTELAS